MCVCCCVTDRSFLVANFQNNSCHIIYCSDGFCRLSGFSRAEVMQRPASCDFMHGPLTSQHAVNVVREALAAGQEKHFEILYYRKDGEFSCLPFKLKYCNRAVHISLLLEGGGGRLAKWIY